MNFDIDIESLNDEKVDELLFRLHEVTGKLKSERNRYNYIGISGMGMYLNPENDKSNDVSMYIELLEKERKKLIEELKELGVNEREIDLYTEIKELKSRVERAERNLVHITDGVVFKPEARLDMHGIRRKLEIQRNIIIGIIGVLIPLIMYVVM